MPRLRTKSKEATMKRRITVKDRFDIPDKYKVMMRRARKVVVYDDYEYAYPLYTFLLERKPDESIEELRAECEDLAEYSESMGSMAKIYECPSKMDENAALMMVSDSRMIYLEQYMSK